MCKTRHWCCAETKKMRCSSCPQGGYSLARKIRLVPNGWLAGSYMVTTKRKVQSSWEFRDRWVGYQQKKRIKFFGERRERLYPQLLLLCYTVQDAITYILIGSLGELCKLAIICLMFLISKLKHGKIVMFPNQKTQDLHPSLSDSMALFYKSRQYALKLRMWTLDRLELKS